mgnify:CR=1 FL=1
MMPGRQYSKLDEMIIGFDSRLGTLFRPSVGSKCKNPSDDIAENPLLKAERKLSASLMRINHAGEVSAQALYQGQGMCARDPAIRRSTKKSAEEEEAHLAWCDQRLMELGEQTSYLNPLWYIGSFTIGAFAGFCGDKWSLGFITESERQVVKHLQEHLQRLPERDLKSRAIVEQMKIDELHHATVALQAGAVELPGPVKQLMKITSKVMTNIACRI